MKKVVKSLEDPLIFTYNVTLGIYKNFGTRHFQQIEQLLQAQPNMRAILLPIISYPEDSIEARAKQAAQKIPEVTLNQIKNKYFLADTILNPFFIEELLHEIRKEQFESTSCFEFIFSHQNTSCVCYYSKILQKLGAKKAHILSYSTSGIDLRYMISEFKGNEFVSSLSTIASPHKGAKVITAFERKLIQEQHLQSISRLTGVDFSSFQEYRPSNIKDFNSFVVNQPDVAYFSVGGEKMIAETSDSLKASNLALFQNYKHEQGAPIDNDGVFCFDEIEWGQHLLNFEADHGDLVGLGRNRFNYSQVYDLLIQNLRYNFGTVIGEEAVQYQ